MVNCWDHWCRHSKPLRTRHSVMANHRDCRASSRRTTETMSCHQFAMTASWQTADIEGCRHGKLSTSSWQIAETASWLTAEIASCCHGKLPRPQDAIMANRQDRRVCDGSCWVISSEGSYWGHPKHNTNGRLVSVWRWWRIGEFEYDLLKTTVESCHQLSSKPIQLILNNCIYVVGWAFHVVEVIP